jgi:hypothetical protein
MAQIGLADLLGRLVVEKRQEGVAPAASTTAAPRRAKAWAVARPMPLDAPVITTTR